jgi:hypothetical protein
MAHPVGSQAAKVGVVLAREPDDLGEWLADGAAFETAGADALWVELAPATELDPLALTAALAAVTVRSLVITSLPVDRPAQARSSTLATLDRLSHGRLRVLADAVLSAGPTAAGAGQRLGIFRQIPGPLDAFEHLQVPDGPGRPDEAERWVSVPPPDSRAAWRATLLDVAQRGFHGLLVPASPGLLDILRNPDDPGHRHDLQLAQG